MKPFRIILLNLAISFLLFCSCVYAKDSYLTEESRDVAPFSSITVSSGIQLFLTQGNEHTLHVVANESVIDRVRTETKNGKLIVGFDSRRSLFSRVRRTGKIEVYITFTRLEDLKASSGAMVKNEDILELDDINVTVSSGAMAHLNLNSHSIYLRASSGANIKLSGTSESVKGEASSGANISGVKMKCEIADLSTSSGANIDLHVNGALHASASSGGNIRIYGDAHFRNISQSSGGSIVRR